MQVINHRYDIFFKLSPITNRKNNLKKSTNTLGAHGYTHTIQYFMFMGEEELGHNLHIYFTIVRFTHKVDKGNKLRE